MRIEKNIPAPVRGTGPNSKYPWPDMEVGDSVFFKGNYEGVVMCPAYASAINYNFQNKPKKFSGRKVEGGVRIWRVA